LLRQTPPISKKIVVIVLIVASLLPADQSELYIFVQQSAFRVPAPIAKSRNGTIIAAIRRMTNDE
jgi:hypothetical protein